MGTKRQGFSTRFGGGGPLRFRPIRPLVRRNAICLGALAVLGFSVPAAAKGGGFCEGVALKKICMDANMDEPIKGECALPQEVGTKFDIMGYEYHGRRKYYSVYRLGTVDAKYVRIETRCKLGNYRGDDLDIIVREFDKRCGQSRSLADLLGSAVVYKDGILILGKPVLPKGVSLDGDVTMQSKKGEGGGYSITSIPLVGTYRGLDVIGMDYLQVHESGMISLTIVFAQNVERVSRSLEGTWSLKSREVPGDDNDGYTYSLRKNGDHTLATCDWSG